MPALPPIWDPSSAVDKLPQPFRMLDKLVAEIVEAALCVITQNEKKRRAEEAAKIDLTFAPHAVLAAEHNIECFCPLGLAGIALCGTPSGQVLCYSARAHSLAVTDSTHTSAVTALDTAQVVTTSARWAATASAALLVIHEVDVKTCAMRTVAMAHIPEDPDGKGTPAQVSFSPNAGHVAVSFTDGSLIVYETPLPDRYVGRPLTPRSAAEAAAVVAAAPPVELRLVLHMPVATVRHVLVGNPVVTACRIVWQQQQRPDKTGRSDRYHRAARGLYMYWSCCNKLLLTCFDVIAKEVRSSAAAARGLFAHTREWLLPHGITCAASTSDATLLAFGLMDGTVLVWDDKFGGHVKILPRMTGAVTALCYVNGQAQKLMCTASDGSLRMADLVHPEDDSWAANPLPCAVTHIHFVPMLNDPLALLICQGNAAQKPRLLWYDVVAEKLVGELLGLTKDSGFGHAGLPLPPSAIVGDGTVASTVVASASSATAATPAADAASRPSTTMSSTAPTPCQEDEAAQRQAGAEASTSGRSLPYPAFSIKDSYLVAGGHVVTRRKKSNFDDEETVTQTAQLYMYKVDALLRHLLPDDDSASKGMLERLLADMEAPQAGKKNGKSVRMDVPDPNAPVLLSSLRKAEAKDEALWGSGSPKVQRRHIQFNEDPGAFDDEPSGKVFPKETKVFPKESRKGDSKDGRPKLQPLSLDKLKSGQQSPGGGPPLPERPQSPPWHHTNPLARIHPDWEEAPVLARIMDRIGHKGGGRKKRDKRIDQVTAEMTGKFAREGAGHSNLLVL